MVFLVIIGLVIAVVAILFAFQNSTVVTISLGVWQFKQSLAIVLLATLGLGIIISLLLSVPTIIKRGWQTSRQRNKILSLESELQSRDTEISGREQKSKVYEQKNQELLQAFELNDPVTGLLKQDAAITLAEYLLEQLKTPSGNTRYNSLCGLLLAIEPAKSNRNTTLEIQENAIYRAIANRLRIAAAADSFLGVTDRKRFIYLASGLMGQKAAEHGEYLIERLTESPLQKADGTTLPLKVFIGGAIADPADIIDARQLFKQAEQNLEIAKEQRRELILITEVTTQLSDK